MNGSLQKITKIALGLTLLCQFSYAATSNVSFLEPKNGEVVNETFKVKMQVQGMKVCPANIETKDEKCGHHHILIDKKHIEKNQVIPTDTQHLHYGNSQSETEITLSPGKHTLTLQFADFAHRSYGKEMSSTINIEVKKNK